MNALEKIKVEQARLQVEIKDQERRLNEKFRYLENNVGKIAINSFLPFNTAQMEKASNLFTGMNSFILKALPSSVSDEKREKYQNMLKTVEMAATGLAYKYISRFLK
ncbi:MAG: hypothetical protein JNL88_08215 [Bacteroidia bacterium]|nr:hypothetical protein [Bacteroidia bacterium]